MLYPTYLQTDTLAIDTLIILGSFNQYFTKPPNPMEFKTVSNVLPGWKKNIKIKLIATLLINDGKK